MKDWIRHTAGIPVEFGLIPSALNKSWILNLVLRLGTNRWEEHWVEHFGSVAFFHDWSRIYQGLGLAMNKDGTVVWSHCMIPCWNDLMSGFTLRALWDGSI